MDSIRANRLGEPALTAILAYLRHHTSTAGGRTYAGGLVKFEPKELERLLLPRLRTSMAISPKEKLLPNRWTAAQLQADVISARSTFVMSAFWSHLTITIDFSPSMLTFSAA